VQQEYFGGTPAGTPPAAPPVAPTGARRRPGGSGPLSVLAVVAVLALVAGLVAVAGVARPAPLPALHQVTEPGTSPPGWSPAWVDDDGNPVRWDPCTPIAYVVNPTWMPARGREDLVEALRRITAASGLEFVDEGDTDELPMRGRPAYQPDRYGDRWAPVLVAWVPRSATDLGLGDSAKGLAATTAVPTPAGGSLVTAQVALDADLRRRG
jgi:hypothetical protein